MFLIKTTASAFVRVQETIRELSSYELPECISISVEEGNAAYLKWIADSVA